MDFIRRLRRGDYLRFRDLIKIIRPEYQQRFRLHRCMDRKYRGGNRVHSGHRFIHSKKESRTRRIIRSAIHRMGNHDALFHTGDFPEHSAELVPCLRLGGNQPLPHADV